MEINWHNYFLTSKHSRLTQGHLKASELYQKILDHNGSTAFCCYFDLDEKLLKFEWDTLKLDSDNKKIYEYHLAGQKPKNPDYPCNGKTFTQYEGIAKPSMNMVSFDFDDEDDPANAMDDVKKFLEWLDLDPDNICIFFSGSKGFHVMIPFCYFPLEANEHLPNQLKDLAKYLEEFYPTLDTSIYNYNRKFRVPFTKHDKSGLYKNYVSYDFLFRSEIEDIIEASESPNQFDFLNGIDFERTPVPVLSEAIENSKRKSYEIQKERAGTKEKPSPFESFDNKLCIKKMVESRCDDIGRNNACMRIVNDFYRTGKTQQKCEEVVSLWASHNGLPLSEVSMIISNIYERHQNYNFGCQDECKSTYCSAKCDIWKKLDPEKRPITVDMPKSALAENNQAKQPKEFDVVKKILLETFACEWDDRYKKFEGGYICKQGKKDLFFFKQGYWQHLNDEQIDLIKIKFNAIYDNILTTRRIENIFKMFMMYVPSKPKEIDMFVPRNNVANFANGTLHLVTDGKGNYSFDFREHNKEDYITFKVDFDYDPDMVEQNEKFENWLYEYLSEDQEQYDLVQEMFGASLVPTFPQFFVLLGPSGTGKTTCIKVLKKIHGDGDTNICKVPPHKFNGFNMASMVGKLVNIVTDINTHAKIDDDTVKQVEDRDTVRIERKGQEDIYAPLPALHIFGANDMPHTLEGYSGAMNRRWSIIKFSKVFSGVRNRNIANLLFDNNPQGVVNFAVGGLLRLACNNQGFFSKSTASVERVNEWTVKDDIIQRFINDCVEEGIDTNGELIKLEVGVDLKINRSKLWQLFKVWQEEALNKNNQIGRNDFFDSLEVKKYHTKKYQGIFKVFGIGELSGKDLGDDSI